MPTSALPANAQSSRPWSFPDCSSRVRNSISKTPHKARYGHSRDHHYERPQIILAVATDTPAYLHPARHAYSTTLRRTVKILRRRFKIQDAVFVFDGGMSSKINLQSIEDEGLEFVTRVSKSALKALFKDLPGESLLDLRDALRAIEVENNSKRHVIAGGPLRKDHDREHREVRIAKAEAALTNPGFAWATGNLHKT